MKRRLFKGAMYLLVLVAAISLFFSLDGAIFGITDSGIAHYGEPIMKAGQLLKEDTYRIISIDNKRIVAERLATGSQVRVTMAMIQKTRDRLANGAFIPRRTISYTVAIEFIVVAFLGSSIRKATLEGINGYKGVN